MPPTRSNYTNLQTASQAISQSDLSTAFITSADIADTASAINLAQNLAGATVAAQPTARKRKAPAKNVQQQQQQQQQQQHQQQPLSQKRKTRTKWTDAETNDLLRGCNTYGVGNWKKILQDPQFTFNSRSAVDLKDRFRTYFPDEYRRLYPNATTHGGRRQRAPLPNALPKVNRKERRSFTPEEDARLLEGFLKHGPSWSKIQKDEELHLFERRSTDLRDRFRNAFPEKYAAAGFKTRPKHSAGNRQTRTAPVETVPEQGVSDIVDNILNGNAANWGAEDDHNGALFGATSDLVDPTAGAGGSGDAFYDASSGPMAQLVGSNDNKIPIDPKVTEASARRK
ncbi:hypothetical protein V1509DRAFT_616995 [Lipomyces kononenkoae]